MLFSVVGSAGKSGQLFLPHGRLGAINSRPGIEARRPSQRSSSHVGFVREDTVPYGDPARPQNSFGSAAKTGQNLTADRKVRNGVPERRGGGRFELGHPGTHGRSVNET